MMRLQRCAECGAAQYPSREICGVCLSDRLHWETADAFPGRVLARTVLHHSNEPGFRAHLPLTVGLVRLDAGPVVVCFLAGEGQGDDVRVRKRSDDLLEANRQVVMLGLDPGIQPAVMPRRSSVGWPDQVRP